MSKSPRWTFAYLETSALCLQDRGGLCAGGSLLQLGGGQDWFLHQWLLHAGGGLHSRLLGRHLLDDLALRGWLLFSSFLHRWLLLAGLLGCWLLLPGSFLLCWLLLSGFLGWSSLLVAGFLLGWLGGALRSCGWFLLSSGLGGSGFRCCCFLLGYGRLRLGCWAFFCLLCCWLGGSRLLGRSSSA